MSGPLDYPRKIGPTDGFPPAGGGGGGVTSVNGETGAVVLQITPPWKQLDLTPLDGLISLASLDLSARTGVSGVIAGILAASGITLVPNGYFQFNGAGPFEDTTDGILAGSRPDVFTTFDPANIGPGAVLSNGDLTFAGNGSGNQSLARSIQAVTAGKYYWEYTIFDQNQAVGIVTPDATLAGYPGKDTHGWGYIAGLGGIYSNNSPIQSGLAVAAIGDTIGVAFDATAGTLQFYLIHGSMQTTLGSQITGLSGLTLYGAVGFTTAENTSFGTANFGASALIGPVPAGYNAGIFSPPVVNGGVYQLNSAGTAIDYIMTPVNGSTVIAYSALQQAVGATSIVIPNAGTSTPTDTYFRSAIWDNQYIVEFNYTLLAVNQSAALDTITDPNGPGAAVVQACVSGPMFTHQNLSGVSRMILGMVVVGSGWDQAINVLAYGLPNQATSGPGFLSAFTVFGAETPIMVQGSAAMGMVTLT